MKPLQSNRPLTHTSMKQSQEEGPSEEKHKKRKYNLSTHLQTTIISALMA